MIRRMVGWMNGLLMKGSIDPFTQREPLSPYLPAKGQEVHDVVHAGGALDVSPVHVHGVLELLCPGGGVYTQGVDVSVGHVHQAAHHAVEI